MSEPAPYEGWAIVEIMGHRRRVGRVSTTLVAGAPMLQVDCPVAGKLEETRPQFYPAASLFALTPISEVEAAREVAPAQPYTPALPAKPSTPTPPTEREKWIVEVLRCATLAHDGAGAAMVSGDQEITAENRDALGRLMAIVEVGIAERFITAEGTEPIASPGAIDGEFDDPPSNSDDDIPY